jgi:hypothetical protein
VFSFSWDLQPRYRGLLEVEEVEDTEELMEDILGDLVEEGNVLNLLLYLWLESGVEFLSSLEAVLDEDE